MSRGDPTAHIERLPGVRAAGRVFDTPDRPRVFAAIAATAGALRAWTVQRAISRWPGR